MIRVAETTTGVEAFDNPGVEDLKTAIVYQACADYLCALRGKTHHCHNAMDKPDTLEAFFRSDWFKKLCSADGEALIRQLRINFQKGQKFIHYGRYIREN